MRFRVAFAVRSPPPSVPRHHPTHASCLLTPPSSAKKKNWNNTCAYLIPLDSPKFNEWHQRNREDQNTQENKIETGGVFAVCRHSGLPCKGGEGIGLALAGATSTRKKKKSNDRTRSRHRSVGGTLQLIPLRLSPPNA